MLNNNYAKKPLIPFATKIFLLQKGVGLRKQGIMCFKRLNNKILMVMENANILQNITKHFKYYSTYDEDFDPRVIWLKNYADYIYKNAINGNVAECGVFRGDFSYYINKYFYDRKVYLFDTFEGFSKKDLDVEFSLSDDSFLQGKFAQEQGLFKSTSVNMVMRKVPNAESCIIKKGYFPQTAIDVNDSFCFVNLDMDLYQPTLDGLDFFWQRLPCGGVILLHDYFHPDLPGVALAVADFEKNIQKCVNKLPIGDSCSIALIKD